MFKKCSFFILALVISISICDGQQPLVPLPNDPPPSGPPSRTETCWIVETMACFDQALHGANIVEKSYCELTDCEKRIVIVSPNQTTEIWDCKKADAEYMTNETYQGARKIYGDRIGKTQVVEESTSVVCVRRYACTTICSEENGRKCGLGSFIANISQKSNWKLTGEPCRGPTTPPAGPIIVE